MHRITASYFVLLIATTLLADEIQIDASKWGSLEGRFLYDGKPPVREPLVPIRRAEAFAAEPLLDQTLMVHEKNRGVANVVIWLSRDRNAPLPPIHPSFEDSSEAEVEINVTPRSFKPRAVLLRTTQSLQLVNDDTVATNFKIDSIINRPYNVLVPAGTRFNTPLSFSKAERIPVKVSSSIYPWVQGHLFVQDHPYFAVTDANGRFEIKDLPVGDWTFRTWHERNGYLHGEVTVGMIKQQWKRGEFEVTITAGENDIREIYIPPLYFKPA